MPKNVSLHMQSPDQELKNKALSLLQKLIETPSFSKEEEITAVILKESLENEGVQNIQKLGNNVWAVNKYFDKKKPSILLNSHHDTVKPNASYTRNPHQADLENDKLFGLGSNDAGGSLVALWATFIFFYDQKNLLYNLVFAATAEEEISGRNGIEAILNKLPEIQLAIVGEPTSMHMAIAEKGLLVLDCTSKGEAGHAARNEGKNAIYAAIDDITWFKNYKFDKESEILGPVKMSVTMVQAGTQHNVVPDNCSFVVDVRTTEAYSMEETLAIIQKHVKAEVIPRSLRLKPSAINLNHPIVKKGLELGMTYYGSPTLSDQALLPFTSIKIGPGDSARSHTADEYILVSEIFAGMDGYIALLSGLEI
jgi:acetylornithine deacetylase